MKEKSLNSKFDFYSSSKEEILNQFESYFKAKEENESEYSKRMNKLKEERSEIELEERSLRGRHQENEWKISSMERELKIAIDEYDKNYGRKKFNLARKKDESICRIDEFIKRSVILILISFILGLAIDFISYIAFIVIIASLLAILVAKVYKRKIFKSYDKEYDLIYAKNTNEKKEKTNYYNGIIKEMYEENYEIREKCSKVSGSYYKIDDKLSELLEFQNNDYDIIRKKFNIPYYIINYENYIYDLLKTNRVSSFNEALDRLELRKHRDELERMKEDQLRMQEDQLRMQEDQLRMQEDQFRQIEEQEEYFRNELEKLSEENIQMNKEISNQIRQQEILINEAKRAAENAEYAAENAEYAVRR